MTPTFDRSRAEAVAEHLRILAHPTRLMILALLRRGEHAVGDIERALSLKQPGLSQQLAELRKSGLVTTRRAAKSVFYRLQDTDAGGFVAIVERILDESGGAEAEPQSAEAAPRPPRTQTEAAVFATVTRRGA
jgi:DNA-binding transcriptional ArsR family regulator